MVVERSLNTLNATIADTRSRVAALEKRKAGGAGVKIYVGPDYRGDGPKLVVPAVPNPDVLTNHAIRPDPITGVHVYTRDGGAMEKYDFESGQWTPYSHPEIKVARFDRFNKAVNGWVTLHDGGWRLANLRTGAYYKLNFPGQTIKAMSDGRYLALAGGWSNPYIFDTVAPMKQGDEYTYLSSSEELHKAIGIKKVFVAKFVNEEGKRKVWLGVMSGGGTVNVAKWEWAAEFEQKYTQNTMRLTAQGNMLFHRKTVPPGTNPYDLLSGHDGRFLGNPWGGYADPMWNGYTVAQGQTIVDPQFSNPVTLGPGVIQKDSFWTSGFVVHDHPRILFYNLDGSLNRAVVGGRGDYIVDYDV